METPTMYHIATYMRAGGRGNGETVAFLSVSGMLSYLRIIGVDSMSVECVEIAGTPSTNTGIYCAQYTTESGPFRREYFHTMVDACQWTLDMARNHDYRVYDITEFCVYGE